VIKQQIERDLKAAMLGGDKKKAETLRVIKSALLYEEVSLNSRDIGISDEQAQKVLAREAKKRAEAAELYAKAGEEERAQAELTEKAVIDNYLPAQLSEADVRAVVNEELSKLDSPGLSNMGQVIGAARGRLGAQADGSLIARLVKEALK